MRLEIVETPVRFRLHGLADAVENEQYAKVGLRLMDALWQAVKGAGLPTTGVNHWVYLPGGRMFVGVELRDPSPPALPAPLAPLAFELPRHLRHVHVGPYQELPGKWRALHAALQARGETLGAPSLEIYGHACADPAQSETTILIALASPDCPQ